jgi:hypothetical protein
MAPPTVRRRGTDWNLRNPPSLVLCCSTAVPTRQVKPMGHPSLLLLPATEIVQVSELRHTLEISTVTGQWKVRIRTDRYSHCDTAQLCTRSITCWYRSTVKCACNGTAGGRKASPLQADSVSCRLDHQHCTRFPLKTRACLCHGFNVFLFEFRIPTIPPRI